MVVLLFSFGGFWSGLLLLLFLIGNLSVPFSQFAQSGSDGLFVTKQLIVDVLEAGAIGDFLAYDLPGLFDMIQQP